MLFATRMIWLLRKLILVSSYNACSLVFWRKDQAKSVPYSIFPFFFIPWFLMPFWGRRSHAFQVHKKPLFKGSSDKMSSASSRQWCGLYCFLFFIIKESEKFSPRIYLIGHDQRPRVGSQVLSSDLMPRFWMWGKGAVHNSSWDLSCLYFGIRCIFEYVNKTLSIENETQKSGTFVTSGFLT